MAVAVAIVTMQRTPVHVARIGTTTLGTPIGTSGFGPPVTTNLKLVSPATARLTDPKWSATLNLLRQTQNEVRITASSETSKAEPTFFIMGKKHNALFEQIHDRTKLWEAYSRASLGKKRSMGYLCFRQYEAANIEKIISSLEDGTYTPGNPHEFHVYEPKKRKISALPFLDRIVQHSLHAALEPIFEKVFLPSSFACRKGRGTHTGVKHVQSTIRRQKAGEELWCLKLDFKNYFHSIDREILWREIERKITCQKTLKLLAQFHPREGKGLPIGNLTSQLLANVYGHILDRFLVHRLGVKRWARYMDDTVIFGNSKEELREIYERLTEFVALNMKMRWSKWSIRPVSKGVNFLGYRIWATHKLIRPDSVRRAKRKIKRYTKHNETQRLNMFVASWKGHIQWANCHNLKQTLLGEEQNEPTKSNSHAS